MLKKVNLNFIRSAMPIIALVLLALIIALVSFRLPQTNDRHLSHKINEYAKEHGIPAAEVQKDKSLMAQFQIEYNQESELERLAQNIQVTEEELESYRDMLGESLNSKKAILIFFNSPDECKSFIETYGNDLNPHTRGLGIVPLMQGEDENAYYNIAGNEKLEDIFSSLKDGDHTKEPFSYSGMFCYLKRICIDSPVDSDEKLIELIKSEKAQTLLQIQQGGVLY